MKKTWYFNDEPVLLEDQYAAAEYEYDARGRMTKESYLNEKMERVMMRRGYSAIVRVYDNAGNTLQIRLHLPDATLGIAREIHIGGTVAREAKQATEEQKGVFHKVYHQIQVQRYAKKIDS